MTKRKHKKGRNLWRHILATTVVAFSVTPPTAMAGRGQLFDEVLQQFDADKNLVNSERAFNDDHDHHGRS